LIVLLLQVTNNYRQTPLHIAARMQMLPIVTMLLEHGGIPLSLPGVPPFIST
jgi:ankyrin repeat protein